MNMSGLVLLNCIIIFFSWHISALTFDQEGLKVYVSTDLLNISFNEDATLSYLYYKDTNIVTDKDPTFRLDWHLTADEIPYQPTKVTLVRSDASRAHFYYSQESSTGVDEKFNIQLHYYFLDGVNGIYTWAKYINDQNVTLSLGTTRVIYRFEPSIFTEATNSIRNDRLYLYSYLEEQVQVQDETWQLPDGSYYTKYDFAGYLREISYQGVYGNGFGAFVISPSREYHNGGPLKQELTVHQDALILNVFHGPHFGTDDLVTPPGWNHIYGPYMIYFNTGEDATTITQDVLYQSLLEKEKWPYDFVDDEDYPLKRGAISGKVTGQKKAAIAVYNSLDEQFDEQSLGYMYTTETDSDGSFSLSKIRPGIYRLVAYSLAGQASDTVIEIENVEITENSTTDVGTIDLSLVTDVVWSLGEANRRANEFRYSTELRNYVWQTLPPANLSFIVDQDDPMEDWYYAQTKLGVWTIQYEDSPDAHPRKLRVAFAAASKEAHVAISLNGENLGDVSYPNDKAVYRSALQSGHYRLAVINVDEDLTNEGTNYLQLELIRGEVMYDCISMQIVTS